MDERRSALEKRLLDHTCLVCMRRIEDRELVYFDAGEVIHSACSESGNAPAVKRIAAFLRASPGQRTCHQCLAGVMSLPSAVVRKAVTALRVAAGFRAVLGGRCATCGHERTTVGYIAAIDAAEPAGRPDGDLPETATPGVADERPQARKCGRCSLRIQDSDRIVVMDGEWFHAACVRITVSEHAIVASRQRTRQARRTLDAAQGRSQCTKCGLAIERTADFILTESGAHHRVCPARPPTSSPT